tara:strand:+ start:456 stop:2411 length:1956 start_codon:yes stop_codon:yes gene_type:complete
MAKKTSPKRKTASKRLIPTIIKKKRSAKTTPPVDVSFRPSKGKQLLLTDVAIRDGQQSLLATRVRTDDLLASVEKMDRVGYWSLEVWGGATFDTCLRFLKEDPWERLRQFRSVAPNTRLQMLLRGQNLLGYAHYPDDVVEAFVERSASNGMDVFRIFDALNDLRNLETSIKAVKNVGKHAQGTLCYTTSPVHTIEMFVKEAKELESMGIDSLCIKDMAGLIVPLDAYVLIRRLKKELKVPIHLHAHATSGMASMSHLMAILGGLDVIDTAMSPLSGGSSHPPTESLIASLRGTPYDTKIDLRPFPRMAGELNNIRTKYRKFESVFTGVDSEILISQVPGGMLSSMSDQLSQQNMLGRMKEVLDEVPRVREDMGYPPLVTPSSQIVGTQATLNVITGERYKVITNETRNYVKGLYGRPPGDISPELRKRALRSGKAITSRPADRLKPELKKLKSALEGTTSSLEDILSYALFPQVAKEFFEQRAKGELKPEPIDSESTDDTSSIRSKNLAPREFNLTLHGESYRIEVAGASYKTEGQKPYYIRINDQLEEVYLEAISEIVPGASQASETQANLPFARPKPQHPGDVSSPMPGKVVKVLVKEGDQIKKGAVVLIVEAMKMESQVVCSVNGTVAKVNVTVGDDIQTDETLVVVG